MPTKTLVPRASGEGGIGATDNAWGHAYYDTGDFNKGLFVSGKNIEQVIADTITGGGLGGVWGEGAAGVIYYNGGNVGIGTTAPIVSLDIHGTLGFKSVGAYVGTTNAGGDTNSNDLTLTAASATNSIVARSAQKIIFQVYEAGAASTYREAMRITSHADGSNVGIGTTSPDAKLDVNGAIRANGMVSTFSSSNSGTGVLCTYSPTTHTAGTVYMVTVTRTDSPSATPTIEVGYVTYNSQATPLYAQVLNGNNILIQFNGTQIEANNTGATADIYMRVLQLG